MCYTRHTLASVAALLPVWCWWWRNKEGAAAAAAVVVVVLESCPVDATDTLALFYVGSTQYSSAHLWCEGVVWAGVGGECLRLCDASISQESLSVCFCSLLCAGRR